MIQPMTRHKATHTGLGTPSLLDQWINALLCSLAMLVSHVARRFAPKRQKPIAECDGDQASTPEANFVLDQRQEPQPAATSCQTPEALILRTRSANAELVDSKDEGGLTALSTSHPRARPEDLGWFSGGTLAYSHNPATE